MQLGKLSSVQSWLPGHPTETDPLWLREALAVNEMEIQLFYARAGLNGCRTEAVEAIDALQAAVILSSFNGEIDEPPGAIIMHEPPENPFLVDELIDGLVKLRPTRRQACLYALETHKDLSDIVNLTWKNVRKLSQVPNLAREILEVASATRHMTLPYVFWEWATPTIAAPLLELQWSVERAFDCTWPELAHRYSRMIMVNRHADATSFLELANRDLT